MHGQLGTSTPREEQKERRVEPVEDLESIQLDGQFPEHVVRIGSRLPGELREKLINFLKEYEDAFAWSHEDMPGIDPEVIVHRLKVNEHMKPIIQKRRKFNPERYRAINEEVKKLLKAGFIREVNYPQWLANIVLVKKANGK